MKKSKTTTGAPCTSVTSGGGLKCVLQGEHAIHSTSADPRRSREHATWTALADGRIKVTAYSRGKKMSDWIDDAPPAPEPSERDIDAEIAREFEEEVQKEIANPSRAEERFRAGESVMATELLAAREAKTRKKAAKASKAKESDPATIADLRPAAQRCYCGGPNGRSKPHELAGVGCRIPDHEMCLCETAKERVHMIGSPGCEAQARPPMLAEADAAATAAQAPEEATPKKPVLDSEAKLMRAHRSKQAEARAEAAQRAKAKKKPPPPMRFCNEREGDTMRVCVLSPGHEGDHDSSVKTWPAAKPPESVDDRVHAMIVAAPGRTAPQIGRRYSKAIAKLEADGRIEWRDEGWWPVAQSAKPAPMTLEDEPEDPEADIDSPDEPDSAARWHCEALFVGGDGREHKCEARNEHSGPHYAWSEVRKETVHEVVAFVEPSEVGTMPDVSIANIRFDQGKKCPKKSKTTAAKCEATALHDDEWVCALAKGHDGLHKSERVPGGSQATWATNDDGSEAGEVRAVSGAGKVMSTTAVGSGGWSLPSDQDREARRQRKAEAIEDNIGTGAALSVASIDADRVLMAQQIPTAPPHVASTSKILGYRRHPAAALFPLLEGEALERFADRIKANGLREPIVLVVVDGETFILDGSNRGVACEMRSVTPRFVNYEGPTDMDTLVAYSLDKNGDGRRHLDPSVRAMIAAESAKLGRGNPGDRETGRSAGLMTQAEAGKRLGVSERLVRRAVVVRDKGTSKVKEAVMKGKLAVEAAESITKLPAAKQDELAERALNKSGQQIKSGTVRALVRQEEKRDIVRRINSGLVAPMPFGQFGVIYGDYPWLYDNSDQHEGSRGHMGYPPMTMDEILAHAREAATRTAKDCILALWVTNLHIPNIGRVVETYGAEHHTMLTWPKARAGVGSWPRGQTEHLVIASIGAPVHTLNEISTLLPSWSPAHPDEHSSKPAEVAEMLAKHCGGPFLELFARDQRENWTCWGAEVDKFAATEAA